MDDYYLAHGRGGSVEVAAFELAACWLPVAWGDTVILHL
jgi:hypothetical protein